MSGKLKSGYLQVYTGSGKGKTTAAFGLALRSWGQGLAVCIIQFMKKNPDGGEYKASRKLGHKFIVKQFGAKGFVISPSPKHRQIAQRAFYFAERVILANKYDLVILDEINCALKMGLITKGQVTALLAKKPSGLELVFTGRGAPCWLIQQAALVTKMQAKKHYFSQRVLARRGIEY